MPLRSRIEPGEINIKTIRRGAAGATVLGIAYTTLNAVGGDIAGAVAGGVATVVAGGIAVTASPERFDSIARAIVLRRMPKDLKDLRRTLKDIMRQHKRD